MSRVGRYHVEPATWALRTFSTRKMLCGLAGFSFNEFDMRLPVHLNPVFSCFLQTQCVFRRTHGCTSTSPFTHINILCCLFLCAIVFVTLTFFFRIFPAGTIVIGFFRFSHDHWTCVLYSMNFVFHDFPRHACFRRFRGCSES